MEIFKVYSSSEKNYSVIYRFFEAQCKNPTKGDWASSVKKVICDIDLNMNFEEIRMTKNKYFKKLVYKKKLHELHLNICTQR